MSAPILLKQRLILSRCIIASVRCVACAYFDAKNFGSSAEDVIICTAIFIGQAEGKTMTAGKLATFIGMPRTTVTRKLQLLVTRGLVEWSTDSKRVSLPEHAINTPKMVKLAAELTNHLQRAAQELTKLGT